MPVCPRCDETNPEGAPFCDACGLPFAVEPDPEPALLALDPTRLYSGAFLRLHALASDGAHASFEPLVEFLRNEEARFAAFPTDRSFEGYSEGLALVRHGLRSLREAAESASSCATRNEWLALLERALVAEDDLRDGTEMLADAAQA